MPDGLGVGFSSVCTLTVVGGMVSITNGTVAGLTEQIAGGDVSLATAAEHTPKLKAWGVEVNVRASSTPNPSCPVSVTVNVQPDPGVPSPEVGTVIVTRPGVSPPFGLSWATETCGVPTEDDPDSPEVEGEAGAFGLGDADWLEVLARAVGAM
jgi:hypothetical protein